MLLHTWRSGCRHRLSRDCSSHESLLTLPRSSGAQGQAGEERGRSARRRSRRPQKALRWVLVRMLPGKWTPHSDDPSQSALVSSPVLHTQAGCVMQGTCVLRGCPHVLRQQSLGSLGGALLGAAPQRGTWSWESQGGWYQAVLPKASVLHTSGGEHLLLFGIPPLHPSVLEPNFHLLAK